MIFYSHNLTITITMTASGRHLRGVLAFITVHGARCTPAPAPAPALDSSAPCFAYMHHAPCFKLLVDNT